MWWKWRVTQWLLSKAQPAAEPAGHSDISEPLDGPEPVRDAAGVIDVEATVAVLKVSLRRSGVGGPRLSRSLTAARAALTQARDRESGQR